MTNTFVSPTVVAKECCRQLANNCVMANKVFRGYEEEFNMLHRGWKPGASINVKVPVYFRTYAARDITSSKVDLFEQSTAFSVSTWNGVAFTINSTEATQDVDIFAKRFVKPAMQAIANKIDETLLGLYSWIPNQVGTPGTTPQSLLTYLQAHARLTEESVPLDDRVCVINPQAKIYLADHVKALYDQPIVGKAVERAMISSNIAGFEMYESQNVQSHTCGTAAGVGTVLVEDTIVEDDVDIDIDTNGSWTLTLTAGDIFSIAGVNACNPISGTDRGYVRQFVCRTHTDNGINATISCIPGVAPWNIRSSAAASKALPYQNVVDLPSDNDAVTVAGTASQVHPVNMAFHKDAMGLVMAGIQLPQSINWSATETYDGYTVCVSRYFAGDTLTETIRFDVLYGTKVLNPFMACRIAG